MAFTDPFIRRPVLATVVSLLIILLGFQAFSKLTIRQYPQMENALITVTTAYPGANAETIQGYITQPLQQSLASAEGIDYMTSVSRQNVSTVSIYARIGADSDRLFTELLAKAGEVKGEYVLTSINAATDLKSPQAFAAIPLKTIGDSRVLLGDVARVEMGAQSYDSISSFDGTPSVYIAIKGTPSANPLDVIKEVRQIMPEIEAQLPPNLKVSIAYDAPLFIQVSIDEVVKTLIEAVLIVIVVVFLFLGALRSVLIPVITIPLSMIGVLFFMQLMGYSINLLTLLAMVLAIGLVVDDAIVVVENIHRHIEEGKTPFNAAIEGAREIAVPVVSMTITLAAVYAPIGFLEGLTGALFKEFALTLAGAVIISGIVALTLSPMMCAKLLR